MREYLEAIPFSGFHDAEKEAEQKAKIDYLVNQYHLAGTEIYLANLVDRNLPLWTNDRDKNELITKLHQAKATRLHCSYWAEPTDYSSKADYSGLVNRFGNETAVKEYYGDLTGQSMLHRWTQEYQLAKEIGAEAVTFHLIDYFHIDGLWQFSHHRSAIVEGMVYLVQSFLDSLAKQQLLPDGPMIELENAGFGLEYGMQRADDFAYLFQKVSDPFQKLSIAWDTNHLLHALGINKLTGQGTFFLTESEITPQMKALETQYGHNPQELALHWLELNILDDRTIKRVKSLHLSDMLLRAWPYFINGQLIEPYLHAIQTLPTDSEKEKYGENIVLKHYDTHKPLGVTITSVSHILEALRSHSKHQITLVHELKNHELDEEALITQFHTLHKL